MNTPSDFIPALFRAATAARVQATGTANGMERARLNHLADVLTAEMRVQKQQRPM